MYPFLGILPLKHGHSNFSNVFGLLCELQKIVKNRPIAKDLFFEKGRICVLNFLQKRKNKKKRKEKKNILGNLPASLNMQVPPVHYHRDQLNDDAAQSSYPLGTASACDVISCVHSTYCKEHCYLFDFQKRYILM